MSKLSSYYRSINIYVTALNEFKPSLFFLLRFLGVYFIGNCMDFTLNRLATTRLIINDMVCFFLIFAIFQDKKYLRVAFYVFLFELLALLPIYFIIKLSLEGDSEISSPLLKFIV